MVPFGSAPARILGTGASFPGEELDTASLFERLTPEMPPDRRAPVLAHFIDATGIERRAWATGEEDAATLGVAAARAALGDAGVGPGDLGYVVAATSTPPRWTAALASLIAGGLGSPAAFLDVRSGCAGGLYALAVGAMLAARGGRPVLVIGTDTFSKVTPSAERFAVLTAGDGAGALVLGPAEAPAGLASAAFGGDGAHHDLATVPVRLPPQELDPAQWLLTGDPDAFSRRIEEVLTGAMAYVRAHAAPADVTVVHAAKRATSRRVFGDGPGLLFTGSLERHGNLGAASVLVAMHEARAAGLLDAGRRLAIASAGGGPSWGGATWTIG